MISEKQKNDFKEKLVQYSKNVKSLLITNPFNTDHEIKDSDGNLIFCFCYPEHFEEYKNLKTIYKDILMQRF